MKKQPLVLSFALAFSVLTSVLGASNSAYAGKYVVPGTSPESYTGDKSVVPGTSSDSSFVGDSFAAADNADVQIAEVVDDKVILSLKEERQAKLNEVIAKIAAQYDHPSIQAFLNGQENSVEASKALKNAILSLDVSPAKAEALVNALSKLIGDTKNVDINHLNDAVTAYNDILNESSPEVILQLAKNAESTAISSVLKELRVALNKN